MISKKHKQKVYTNSFFPKSRRAAMEMSMGTIVTIVLLMTVLVLGMLFTQNIMCSGIVLTDQITGDMENQIKDLFGSNKEGVMCMGENNQEVEIADGGRRSVGCIIKTDTETNYRLTVESVESISGVETSVVDRWIIDQDWEGVVRAGDKAVSVLTLNIPTQTSATTLKIIINEVNMDTGSEETHVSYVDVRHLGGVGAAIC
jgi:hypothetical protein